MFDFSEAIKEGVAVGIAKGLFSSFGTLDAKRTNALTEIRNSEKRFRPKPFNEKIACEVLEDLGFITRKWFKLGKYICTQKGEEYDRKQCGH